MAFVVRVPMLASEALGDRSTTGELSCAVSPRLAVMTFVNAGTLGTVSGHRDELVAILTQHSDLLGELGCSVYEVGINADAPDTVFVVEVWDSHEAHRRSLEHLEVQASIAAARPILSGEFGGFRFDVIGSPLRDA